jgi:tetratricopeptide (TPR) repeat protein
MTRRRTSDNPCVMTPAETLAQAQTLHRGGNLPEAERRYRQIFVTDPANFPARHLLAVLLAQEGRNEEALAMFAAALALNPNAAATLFNQGNLLETMGRSQDALVSFDKALSLKPDAAEAWNNRGKTLRNLRRPDEGPCPQSRSGGGAVQSGLRPL